MAGILTPAMESIERGARNEKVIKALLDDANARCKPVGPEKKEDKK